VLPPATLPLPDKLHTRMNCESGYLFLSFYLIFAELPYGERRTYDYTAWLILEATTRGNIYTQEIPRGCFAESVFKHRIVQVQLHQNPLASAFFLCGL
jgi:hypothetical protein